MGVEDLDMVVAAAAEDHGVDLRECAHLEPEGAMEDPLVVVLRTTGGETKEITNNDHLRSESFAEFEIISEILDPLGLSPRSAELPSRSCPKCTTVFLADLAG